MPRGTLVMNYSHYSQSLGNWRSIMTTFNAALNGNTDVSMTLKSANRSYMDDGVEGNYLNDFLAKHGEEQVTPIVFHPGNAHGKGYGIRRNTPIHIINQNNDVVDTFTTMEDVAECYGGNPDYSFIETKGPGPCGNPWTMKEPSLADNVRNYGQCVNL